MNNHISTIKIENILFLDIETVPQYASFNDLPGVYKPLWEKKSKRFQEAENVSAGAVYHKAGILAEFGKIICISAGYIKKIKGDYQLRIRSFSGDNEATILKDFLNLFTKYFNTDEHFLCAHNGKEFDFPYIARRALINEIKLPQKFDTRGLKPWEVRHLDTLELWRFGDYKNFSSLELLTTIFNIPSPKSDLNGSMIHAAYWQEKQLERIVQYCQEDVIAIVQLFLKYRGADLFPREQIKYV